MDLGLAGKNAIVTGGSRGIGKAIALSLAVEGVNVATCARNEGPLRNAEQEIRAKGVTVYAQPCDVGKPQHLEDFLVAAHQQLGGVDILVNNVSGMGVGDEISDWEISCNVDLLASVRACKKVIPWMIERGGGNILFISSIGGIEAITPAAYSAVKAGLISYSKILAVTLAPQQIRVNTIAPGCIEFPGGSWAWMKEHNRDMYDHILNSIPWGRMGTPEEIGSVAAFLLSEQASWVTGACLSVDGGQHKGNL